MVTELPVQKNNVKMHASRGAPTIVCLIALYSVHSPECANVTMKLYELQTASI